VSAATVAVRPCETDGGVSIQEHAGKVVQLAVVFDVRVVRPDGETDLTVVVTFGWSRR